ncbi:MAG: crossover junction endodeoxyribonuclease RuvC [Thalassospira sp.]|uniref:crossover junction endodeoxyribonuclease RuvC n=1 Tax=Thalassospira sp. TaxID=1912094 RepID=UPI003A89D680
MKILSLDLGTTTGWASIIGSKPIDSGSKNFSAGRFEGGGMRYLKFRRWLQEILYMHGQLDAVYFEEVRRHTGTDAAHVYGGLLAHLTAWCEENKIAYEGVPVGTIKKHATGKGNAKKDAMIAAARKRGHSPKDDNEADAIALLYWAKEQNGVLL